jgi:hypothetical protein
MAGSTCLQAPASSPNLEHRAFDEFPQPTGLLRLSTASLNSAATELGWEPHLEVVALCRLQQRRVRRPSYACHQKSAVSVNTLFLRTRSRGATTRIAASGPPLRALLVRRLQRR